MSSNSLTIIILLSMYHVASSSDARLKLYLDEIRSLSELPMYKLIQLKTSFNGNSSYAPNEPVAASRKLSHTLPMALPLKKVGRTGIKRYGHEESKGHDSKISKIFQLAISSLSFLAFGGYLLTLIIMAIRRNNGNNTGGNFIIYSSNLQNLQPYARPKRDLLFYDARENDFEIDRLYRGMVMLSRGYAKYN